MQDFGFFLICCGLGVATISVVWILLAVAFYQGKNWRLLFHQHLRLFFPGLIVAVFGEAAYKENWTLFLLAIAGMLFVLFIILLSTHFFPWEGAQKQWDDYNKQHHYPRSVL
ncbi:MAG: hypothetical protein NTY93_03335 [Candidatus Kaiserbacteria bacterium]|nr:hypothetical protein [Candidatus Kaiserbacteria bacterium]